MRELSPCSRSRRCLAWRFVDAVAGRLITSADHGAFIYRYRALARTFPRLISYDPWWNAGMVDESTAITGAALIHLLTWPLTRILPLETAYQWFIPLVAVVTIPWALYAATRLLGFSRLAGVVAALLAMVPADSYFTWLLTYGTLGALVTASLVPLTFVLAWRIFVGVIDAGGWSWRSPRRSISVSSGPFSLSRSCLLCWELPSCSAAVCGEAMSSWAQGSRPLSSS